MERDPRRSIDIDDGSISLLWEPPITAAIMVIAIVIVVLPVIGHFRERRRLLTAGDEGWPGAAPPNRRATGLAGVACPVGQVAGRLCSRPIACQIVIGTQISTPPLPVSGSNSSP